MRNEVPVGLSNRHCHLTEEQIKILFGNDACLTKIKDLSQPGQFACQETVDVTGPKGTIKGIRVLGPARSAGQVELLASDTYKLGVPIVIKDSGDHEGTPGCTVTGPCGSITLEKGVIVAARHIHMSCKEAEEFGVKDGDRVSVAVEGERGLIFNHVLIRAGEKYLLDFHVDTEEGNAAGAKNGMICKIVR